MSGSTFDDVGVEVSRSKVYSMTTSNTPSVTFQSTLGDIGFECKISHSNVSDDVTANQQQQHQQVLQSSGLDERVVVSIVLGN